MIKKEEILVLEVKRQDKKKKVQEKKEKTYFLELKFE